MRRAMVAARWEQIVLVTYRVPVELLVPYLPERIEIDTPAGAPDALASVVALRFADLRVYGLPMPGATSFAEVNLRFYARHGRRRGAVFIRELVSNRLVKLGAWLLSGEPYALARVDHHVSRSDGTLLAITTVEFEGRHGTIRIEADDRPEVPAEGSLEHWLKERYWGFGRGRDGVTRQYRVGHPVWRTYPVREATVAIDPGLFVNEAWRELDWSERQHSVIMAEGSLSTIDRIERLK
jgi:uncharacterized protein